MPALMKPSRLAAALDTEFTRGGSIVTVSAYGLFDVSNPRYLLTEQALWPMVADQMPPGGIFDQGKMKPIGEWLVVGAAMAPSDTPVTGLRVGARLGAKAKSLAVFGERAWRHTDNGIELVGPVPFDLMPIDPSRAFGGPKFKANTNGRGHLGREIVDAGYDAALPNVEYADRLIRSVDDAPPPAHFGPLPPDDAARLALAGTYDSHWVENTAPIKPDDFNPLFHCVAPKDQRLDAHLKGDEAFLVSGMSKGSGVVEGALPDFRARAFAHRLVDDSFRELSMVCETAYLFPNVDKAVVIYRGLCRSDDRFAKDIGTIMIALEDQEASPRPPDHYLTVFRLRSDPETGHEHVLSDHQLMPEREAAIVSERREEQLQRAQDQRDRFVENQNWLLEKELTNAGTPAALVPKLDPSELDDLPLVAMPSKEDMAAGTFDIAAMMDDMRALEASLQKRFDVKLSEAEHYRRNLARSLPDSMVTDFVRTPLVDDEHLRLHPPSPDEAVDSGITTVRDAAQSVSPIADVPDEFRQAEGGDELQSLIADSLEKLDKPFDTASAEKQFQAACARALGEPEGSLIHEAREALEQDALQSVLNPPSNPDLDAPGGLTPETTIGDLKAQGSKGGLPDLDDMISNAPPGTDPAEAKGGLDSAKAALTRLVPDLVDPDFDSDPMGKLFDMAKALDRPAGPEQDDMTVAELAEKSIDEVKDRIDKAIPELEETMSEARRKAPEALFPTEDLMGDVPERLGQFVLECLAEGHSFKDADLAGAVLRGADFSGLDLSGAFFEQADLTGAQFRDANLEGAVFTRAVVDGADFTGAGLKGANLSRVSGRQTRFDRSVLVDAVVVEADFSEASFVGATLENVTIITSILTGADLTEASLADFNVIGTRADRCVFESAVIERANFMRSDLTRVSLKGAQLMRVSFAEANAVGMDASLARLRSVAFVGASDLSGSDFVEVNASEVCWNTAKLTESCFLRGQCTGCLFNECAMSGADLRLATFKTCRFDGSDLTDSDLFGANLFGTALIAADLRLASLRGANLYFADLLEAKLVGCDLSSANLGGTLMERPSDG
ncbi:MAG: DUF2169 domain-containing protein [Pseudomonadota bacterium]